MPMILVCHLLIFSHQFKYMYFKNTCTAHKIILNIKLKKKKIVIVNIPNRYYLYNML